MKSYHWVLVVTAILALFGAVQCSRCASPEATTGDTEVPGKALTDASIRDDVAKLEWEQVLLGISTEKFKAAVAGMLQQEPDSVNALLECGALQGTWLISPVEKAMVEHVTNGKLAFCHLSGHNLKSSSRISSVRGEFLNDRLVQLQFRFRSENYDALVAELSARFGNGDSRELKEMSLLKEDIQSFLLWKIEGVTWGLKKGKKDVTLYIQDVARLAKLPVAAATSADAPPKKTDLSDIGIKGSPYDVNLDDLDVPKDIAVDTDSPKTDSALSSEGE